MQFCKKCGSLMLPKKVDGDVFLTCTSCGHSVKAEGVEEYKMAKKSEEREEVTVVEEEAPSTLPTARTKCPKCGNDQAYWWIRQTRSADEPSTRFYRCTKCKKVWREYA
ncbi:MAG: transcription factor S [Candidatus Hadarchaeota archaeon]